MVPRLATSASPGSLLAGPVSGGPCRTPLEILRLGPTGCILTSPPSDSDEAGEPQTQQKNVVGVNPWLRPHNQAGSSVNSASAFLFVAVPAQALFVPAYIMATASTSVPSHPSLSSSPLRPHYFSALMMSCSHLSLIFKVLQNIRLTFTFNHPCPPCYVPYTRVMQNSSLFAVDPGFLTSVPLLLLFLLPGIASHPSAHTW